MSLFFLKRAACTWEKIKPDWFDESYKDDIDSYLKDMLSETGTDELTKCTNLKMLKSIDRESQNNRNTRKKRDAQVVFVYRRHQYIWFDKL